MSRPAPLFLSALLSLCSAGPALSASTFELVHAFPSPVFEQLVAGTSTLTRGIDGSIYAGGFKDRPVIYKLTGPQQFTVVRELPYDGAIPMDGNSGSPMDIFALVEGPDGSFYGMTYGITGGANATLFKFDAAGAYSELGIIPMANVVLALAGDGSTLYGITAANLGSGATRGTIFRVPAGGQLETVVSFTGDNGATPAAGLLLAQDGNFYGTTAAGGSNDLGILFKLTPGGVFTKLHDFDVAGGNPVSSPVSSLVQRPNGDIYGVGQDGSIFELDHAGAFSVPQTLPSNSKIPGQRGSAPSGALTLGADGALYGTTNYGGGALGGGTIFRYDFAGTPTTLTSFDASASAGQAVSIIQGADGNFYGKCLSGGPSNAGFIYKATAAGAIGDDLDFIFPSPEAGLDGVVQAADGTLYGTTHSSPQFSGAAYKITPDGTLTNLASFTGMPPQGPLQALPGGGFYGVTRATGALTSSTVFTIDTAGTVTTVASGSANALLPPQVVLGSDGNYYGALNSSQQGSIVKITPDGTISTAYAFSSIGGGGAYPNSLVAAPGGNPLYGTTYGGGSYNAGTLFLLNLNDTLQTEVSFQDDTTGRNPVSVIRAADGTLYGVTQAGSTAFALGTVFKYSGNTLSTVHGFTLGDGDIPSQLTAGDDGALYGLLSSGGAYQSGALFRIAANGDYQVLHHFDQASGILPNQLTRGVDGNLYGSTRSSGPAKGGTVFRVRIDSSPAPFETWLAANNLSSGPNGDDDHDGLSNLLEYATGTDPQVANAATAAEQGGTVISHGGLVIRSTGDPVSGPLSGIYARRKDYAASNLTYVVQSSADLKSWSPMALTPEVIANDDQVEIISVGLPAAASAAPAFYRLQVLAP